MGGGVYLYEVKTGKPIKFTVANCVVTGNTATDGQGGGIYGSASAGILISKSTISGNEAKDGSGGGLDLKGGRAASRSSSIRA